MAEVTITPSPDGPLIVKGPVQLVDSEGNEWQIDDETVNLCRCGKSQNKPFCDGTHAKVGFKANTLATAKV